MSQIRKFEQIEKARARKLEKQAELQESRRKTYEQVKKQGLLELQYFQLAKVGFFLMCLVVIALSIYFGLQVFVK